MRFVVDLEKVVVVLRDADDAAQATVVVASPLRASAARQATVHRLADVLAATNMGRLESDGAARLRAEAVRFHAAGEVDDDWERRFSHVCQKDGDDVVVPATVTWPELLPGSEE
ncbi:MAG: hypothetical protein M0010_13385 [Actinomycetota bacterium]|nr:hypothetical protein [Actinomycetota bacterium]